MNQNQFKMLCDDLEQIASQVFDDETAPCQFEDEPESFDVSEDFNLWSDRS